jgi:hypothetical protein
MRILSVASAATFVITNAIASVATAGFYSPASAKSGNGGGSGNSGNGGGNSKGSGSESSAQHASAGQSSVHAKKADDNDAGAATLSSQNLKARKTVSARHLSATLAGLNSLKRNYQAYMNSSDPRMAAISAYAVAYARYELANGTEPSTTDPALGDAALQRALASATKTGTVSPAVISEAKSILGVGEETGKIDQIRNALKAKTSPSGE